MWDGERVRQENKDRLKRYLKESIQLGDDEEPVQHAWAAHVLDACRYEELRQRHTCSSDSCGSSDGCGSSGSDGSSDGGCSGPGRSCEPCSRADPLATFRDWGTEYAGVDVLLRGPRCGVAPGELRGAGRKCAWCSRVPAVGDTVRVRHKMKDVDGKVAFVVPGGSGSVGVLSVDVGGGELVNCEPGGVCVPGSRQVCTAWCGAAPTGEMLQRACMGHLVAYVVGVAGGARHRVGAELAAERMQALWRTLGRCNDRGGVPSMERVWVNHIAAALKYRGLKAVSENAVIHRERERAAKKAKWFWRWGTVFSGVKTLLGHGARTFVPAGQHKDQWVANPKACEKCGAWGVEASMMPGGQPAAAMPSQSAGRHHAKAPLSRQARAATK